MNWRRIQTAVIISDSRMSIDNSEFNDVCISDVVVDFIGGVDTRFKFARRPFAGAHRIIFHRGRVTLPYSAYYLGEGYVNQEHNLWLCVEATRDILKVGKNVKEFSLWFVVNK